MDISAKVRSPKILISSFREGLEEPPFSVEFLGFGDDFLAPYCLTIIAVGADIVSSGEDRALYTTSRKRSPVLQAEGTSNELNELLKKASFVATGQSKCWITFHVEKLDSKAPQLDIAWKGITPADSAKKYLERGELQSTKVPLKEEGLKVKGAT